MAEDCGYASDLKRVTAEYMPNPENLFMYFVVCVYSSVKNRETTTARLPLRFNAVGSIDMNTSVEDN